MRRQVPARELIGRPVVSLAGDDVAEIKDVLLSASGGRILGFTLNGRGFFSGPLKEALPWKGVQGLGTEAVMIAGPDVFCPVEEVLAGTGPAEGNVIGNRVVTDEGDDLGEVTDLVLAVDDGAEIVGYEVATPSGECHFIPLPRTISVSGEALVVAAGEQ